LLTSLRALGRQQHARRLEELSVGRSWPSTIKCSRRFEVRFGSPYDIIGSYAPLILRRFCKAFPSAM
jgi:hypothetical protein